MRERRPVREDDQHAIHGVADEQRRPRSPGSTEDFRRSRADGQTRVGGASAK
jgi:hypothetical protein